VGSYGMDIEAYPGILIGKNVIPPQYLLQNLAVMSYLNNGDVIFGTI